MDMTLWLASSFIMAALLVCLAARAVKELVLPVGYEISGGWKRFSPAKWPGPVLFFGSLGILWLGTFVAYAVLNGGGSGFWDHVFRRFTEAGDGPHYLFIAENGYVSQGEGVNNIVFYPLYPFLTRVFSLFTGGRTALAGMILSQVCYGLSVVVMAKLARAECEYPGYALVAYMLYPVGFFCLGLFTEGLFLFLSILGLYLIREKKWLLAGFVGFLCALCRTQGILLLLPGVYMAWRQCRAEGWKWRYLAVAAPLLGFFVFSASTRSYAESFLPISIMRASSHGGRHRGGWEPPLPSSGTWGWTIPGLPNGYTGRSWGFILSRRRCCIPAGAIGWICRWWCMERLIWECATRRPGSSAGAAICWAVCRCFCVLGRSAAGNCALLSCWWRCFCFVCFTIGMPRDRRLCESV